MTTGPRVSMPPVPFQMRTPPALGDWIVRSLNVSPEYPSVWIVMALPPPPAAALARKPIAAVAADWNSRSPALLLSAIRARNPPSPSGLYAVTPSRIVLPYTSVPATAEIDAIRFPLAGTPLYTNSPDPGTPPEIRTTVRIPGSFHPPAHEPCSCSVRLMVPPRSPAGPDH